MADLNEKIREVREAIAIASSDSPEKTKNLINLHNMLFDRAFEADVAADLCEAIEVAREVVAVTSKDHPSRARRLLDLEKMISHRYYRTRNPNDLNDSIHRLEEAICYAADNKSDLAESLYRLGQSLCERYCETETTADLDNAIKMSRKSVQTTPIDATKRVTYLSSLGYQLGLKFEETNELAYLERSIKVTYEAAGTGSDDTSRRSALSHLLRRLDRKYQVTKAMDDLEECSNGNKYKISGGTTALEQAINLSRKLLDKTPGDHPEMVDREGTLAQLLLCRHDSMGRIADLEESVKISRRTIRCIPNQGLVWTQCISHLGIALGARYRRLGAMEDLGESIELFRSIASRSTRVGPAAADVFNNLGLSLGDRYDRTGALKDLDEYIEVMERCLEFGSKNDPNRSRYLVNLASQLDQRFLRTQVLEDSNWAIRAGREAMRMAPEDCSEKAFYLSVLGGHLFSRGLRTKVDLDMPIQLLRRAVTLAPQYHRERGEWLNNLAKTLAIRFRLKGSEDDFEEAMKSLESSLGHSASPVISRINAGRLVMTLHRDVLTPNWQRLSEALTVAISLVPQLTPHSLETSDKQHFLGLIAKLASNAAAAALQVEKSAFSAVHLLEQGRGLIAASLGQRRSDVIELRNQNVELANEFDLLRGKLDTGFPGGTRNQAGNYKPFMQPQTDWRYESGRDLDNLIVRIRKEPGLETFLLGASEDELRRAAARGPIVVINVSKYRCDAILVEQHQIRCLPLPTLTITELRDRADTDLTSERVLAWLWDVIASPILEALGFTQTPKDDIWPHVWWVPTGILKKFPIHAAGYHQVGPSRTVLDRVMSSYSSTVQAIIQGRKRNHQDKSLPQSAVLVAMAETPDCSRLPFAKEEIAKVSKLCQSIPVQPTLPGLCKESIVSAMRDCTIFHFAGHGYTDAFDPSQSTICTQDWKENPLRVADLLKLNLHQRLTFLAYLSACGTGQTTNLRFADESIDMINAYQIAGFRHVIGTLWQVNDATCVDVAELTYQGIRDGHMSDDSVCRGLHNACRRLRDHWIKQQTRQTVPKSPGRRSVLHERLVRRINKGKRRQRKAAGKPKEKIQKHSRQQGRLIKTSRRTDGSPWTQNPFRLDEQDWKMELGLPFGKANVNWLDSTQTHAAISRDIQLLPESDEISPLWIPYVHFGV